VDLRRLALALLVVPSVLLMLLSVVQPLYVDRYVLYGNAGLALLMGAALHRLGPSRWMRAAAAVAVLTLVPTTLQLRDTTSRTDDVTAVARAIQVLGEPGDGVLYMPQRRRVWSLPYPAAVRGLHDLALDRTPVASRTLYGTEVSATGIRARMLNSSRIVAVGDPDGEPLDRGAQEAVKRDVLATFFEGCVTRRVQGARITLYARPGEC
jgi:mannosyltransferase